MRYLIIFGLITLLFTGCDQPYHTTEWSDDGLDSVVYVRYVDDNGTQNSFYMNYLLFHALYSNGGYNNCYNYYNTHRNDFTNYNSSQYRTYSPRFSRTYRAKEYRESQIRAAKRLYENQNSDYVAPNSSNNRRSDKTVFGLNKRNSSKYVAPNSSNNRRSDKTVFGLNKKTTETNTKTTFGLSSSKPTRTSKFSTKNR